MLGYSIEQDLSRTCEESYDELSALAGETLLFTGCGGFLGYYFSHLFCFWNANNDAKIHVTLQDNFLRGRPVWLDKLDLGDCIDILDRDVLCGYAEFNYQNVIHAASVASPVFYRKHPIETMDANVIGLRNLLDAQCEMRHILGEESRFLYFSTSEIYGDPAPQDIPTSEDYRGNVSCTGPRACYDESKRYGETLCVNFWQSRGLPVTIARPFNNYGPGLKIDDGRAVPDFARSILSDGTITLLSDGSPTRTFCYISDAVNGYLRALVRGAPGESYNIGSETPEISMLNLAREMAAIVEAKSGEVVRIDHAVSEDKHYLVDNPNRRCPDISKAKKDLGFQPLVGLQEGLINTLNWYGVF